MHKISFLCSLAALALVAVGCGDDDVTPMTDGGPSDLGPADLGPRDMNPPPPRDMGPMDPCAAATPAEATATFDCNGAVPGPGAANDLFGACTEAADPATMPEGSCTAGDECFGFADSPSPAFCVRSCTGTGDNYAETADCPAGSRCLSAWADVSRCMPSCEVDADCASGSCDLSDNTCFFAEPLPPMDGGVDAGPADDAGPVDGGPADAGADDAGLTVDLGVDIDLGV